MLRGCSTAVCAGKIIAYHNRIPTCLPLWKQMASIVNYVYGVSLTHGQIPRKHIWTFAGAADETSGEP